MREATMPVSCFATVRHVQRMWQCQIPMDHDKKTQFFPLFLCSAPLLWHYNCERQSASVCLVSRGFPSVSPIFFRISSTAFSKAARSCSRVRMDCFSLPSLVNKSSTVASRFWIFPLATFQNKKKWGEGKRGRKKRKSIKNWNQLYTILWDTLIHIKYFPNKKLQR